MKAALIIPCRNEEECIGPVIEAVRRYFADAIVVVDNGSTDRTPDVASQAGATVVCEPRAGYGRACAAGVAATGADAEAFVFMDGDGSDFPEDIPALLAALDRGAEVAIGVRRGARVEPGAITLPARFGNWLAGGLIGLATGRRIPDLSPLKAVRRESLRGLHLRQETSGWTVELLAKAAARRMAIVEVETGYRHRRAGKSKVSGTKAGSLGAGLRILGVLVPVMITSMSPRTVGVGLGVMSALGALVLYSTWLFAQAPSSSDVLVSTLLLAWPVLLTGAILGGVAGTIAHRWRAG